MRVEECKWGTYLITKGPYSDIGFFAIFSVGFNLVGTKTANVSYTAQCSVK